MTKASLKALAAARHSAAPAPARFNIPVIAS